MKIMVIFGTRPEAIKMAPIVRLAQSRNDIDVMTLSTGQHKEMLSQTCDALGLPIDRDLNVMADNSTLCDVTGEVLKRVSTVIGEEQPDWILVQGDTGTAFAGGLAGFYNKVNVGHVEAGLRSFDNNNPFPEEVNRKLIGTFANLHFAPTDDSAANLRHESVQKESILVTGNTVIDALQLVRERIAADDALKQSIANELPVFDDAKKFVLVTSHRRENHGEALENICNAVKKLAESYSNYEFFYPVHLNPNVGRTVRSILSDVPNVHLGAPVSYLAMVYLMNRSRFILKDSGGIQEEATAFSTPVLVLRTTTERGEGVRAGVAKLIGTEAADIIKEATTLIDDSSAYQSMCQSCNPYGDGHASEHILDAIIAYDNAATKNVA